MFKDFQVHFQTHFRNILPRHVKRFWHRMKK